MAWHRCVCMAGLAWLGFRLEIPQCPTSEPLQLVIARARLHVMARIRKAACCTGSLLLAQVKMTAHPACSLLCLSQVPPA